MNVRLHRRSSFLALAAAGAVAGALAGPAPATAQDKAAKPDDALVTLNKLFRTEYAAARAAVLARTSPVIICQFDDLVLIRDGKTTRAGFTPPIYHEMKSVAHATLTVYVTLARRAGQPVDEAALGVLRDLRARVVAAEKTFAGRPGWTPEILANNRKIVAGTLAVIDRTVETKTITSAALQAYTRRMSPLVLYNADVAARAQLDGMNALVAKWRTEMGPAEWARTRVVVLAPRQARPGSLQYAFFRKLMGPRAEGVRLFYGENIFDVAGAQRLLGTIMLDRGMSVAFFDNPVRLERDMLADAAANYLRTLQILHPGMPAKKY